MATSDSFPPNILQRWTAIDSCFTLKAYCDKYRMAAISMCIHVPHVEHLWFQQKQKGGASACMEDSFHASFHGESGLFTIDLCSIAIAEALMTKKDHWIYATSMLYICAGVTARLGPQKGPRAICLQIFGCCTACNSSSYIYSVLIPSFQHLRE